MGSDDDDDNSFNYSERDSLLGPSASQGETQEPWDTCQVIHRQTETGSMAESKWINTGTKILKFLTVSFVFLVVLCSAVTSKITLFLMTSQIKKNITREYCPNAFDKNRAYTFSVPEVERVTWIWLLMFTFFIPELGTFIRSMRRLIFKSWSFPQIKDFFLLLLTESLPSIGSAIFVFIILPELDVLRGAMLTNAMCLIPSLEFLLRNFQRPQKMKRLSFILDILAVAAQISAFIVWPLVKTDEPTLWFIPITCILISFGWWENFITEKLQRGSSKKNIFNFLNKIAKSKRQFPNSKYFSYAIIAPLKCLVFFCSALMIFYLREGDATFIFHNFTDAFSSHQMIVNEVIPKVSGTDISFDDAISTGVTRIISSKIFYQIIIWLSNIIATYLCYIFGKFACKIMIQASGFAFPINLVVPVTITVLSAICGDYVRDKCVYFKTFPEEITYLFFNIPPLVYLDQFILNQHVYIWIAWLLSQFWITQHIWKNRGGKLAATEQLFMRPMYDAFLIDQSCAMNRRNTVGRFAKEKATDTPIGITNQVPLADDIDLDENKITRIYACGTMWHETREEIMEFLKTIFRMDEDQAAHRIVRKFLNYPSDDYYEWETHIFFDDAYIRKSENDTDPHLNKYVMTLVDSIEEAATEVNKTKVKIRSPVIYPTPYGGRLEWILPGKTKIITHLKDPAKIRKKKRWSQVMYMYYLLGFKIMDDNDLTAYQKSTRAKNTYILALDGDIDFQPEAVHLLVQYMKKKDSLGAACGRIHPIGAGAIAWYQVFEYAVGHWLQKATEHVLGCVLCSPGCFSLFRASALMDHNVMARYTTTSSEARHYVQYDQGEDRWLCTLLLQRGYRVEYSAASDAYTRCPEGFNEFYNQRRRWMPSTMANILDLLEDAKHVMLVNDDISKVYIFYQFILLIGTVIGPGTIFLMLQGAFVTAFGITQWSAFVYNVIPILAFVLVCIFCKSDTQLKAAAIISGVYGLVMMTVIVGVLMQIEQDGILAPSSLFFLIMMGEYVVAALVHPKEFYCLKYGIIYLVTVPSMYLLLVIYSVFNMNNVSWGTREVTVETTEKKDEENKTNETKQEPKKPEVSPIVSAFYALRDFIRGCFGDSQHLVMISNSLTNLEIKTDQINRKVEDLEVLTIDPEAVNDKKKSRLSRASKTVLNGPKASRISARPTISSSARQSVSFQKLPNSFNEQDEDEAQGDDDYDEDYADVPENSWFYDGKLVNGNVDFLDKKEETFWKGLIAKYLHPIQDDKKQVALDLKNLRDQIVMTFFMINALYVLVVFLLTLQKDLIHIKWPFNPKVNFTYKALTTENEIEVNKTMLELQPIGFVFLLFFFLLMFVQFLCMLAHRFGTFSQIMANTNLDMSCCDTKIENISEDELLEKDPIKIFKKLMKLKGVNGDDQNEEEVNATIRSPIRHNTVVGLAQNRKRRLAQVNDFDTAFHIRWKQVRNNQCADVHIPKQTITAIQRRRTTILQRKSQMPNIREFTSFSSRNSTDSGIPEPVNHSYDNPTFETIEESTS